MIKKNLPVLLLISSLMSCSLSNCSGEKSPGDEPAPADGATVSYWVTRGDKLSLLAKFPTTVKFSSAPNNNLTTIEVDSTVQFQTMDGFGYSLTGGSAYLLMQLPQAQRTALLQELFGKNENSISVSYLRISIGASDLDAEVFSYSDLPAGETDEDLSSFSIARDEQNLIPVLKEILAINPAIKIMGSPWSPPTWMKDNNNSKGGSLLTKYHQVYAQYFVKYIQAMKAQGITIDAITPQNEPLHPGNNPSLQMLAEQQRDFIRDALGPAFKAANISTKIVIYDHNLDRPDYPISILNDAGAKQYIDGSAFHLYAGDVSAMKTVRDAHPDKNLYFTEQWTGAKGAFEGDLFWHVKNVIIGTTRNYSKVALEWNLASDANFDPHTPGGCTECKGALTIQNGTVEKNVSYYIIGHASKFVPAGSKRIHSNVPPGLENVAFLTPEGKKVLILVREAPGNSSFAIKYNGQLATVNLQGGSVTTFVWD